MRRIFFAFIICAGIFSACYAEDISFKISSYMDYGEFDPYMEDFPIGNAEIVFCPGVIYTNIMKHKVVMMLGDYTTVSIQQGSITSHLRNGQGENVRIILTEHDRQLFLYSFKESGNSTTIECQKIVDKKTSLKWTMLTTLKFDELERLVKIAIEENLLTSKQL